MAGLVQAHLKHVDGIRVQLQEALLPGKQHSLLGPKPARVIPAWLMVANMSGPACKTSLARCCYCCRDSREFQVALGSHPEHHNRATVDVCSAALLQGLAAPDSFTAASATDSMAEVQQSL